LPIRNATAIARLSTLPSPKPACLAIEDSENGLKASLAAGLETVITPTGCSRDHDYAGALARVPDLGGVTVAQLRHWHAIAYAEDKHL
jgi:beta-phosphoglucomutase-like phosphatase (HAD superfamily)